MKQSCTDFGDWVVSGSALLPQTKLLEAVSCCQVLINAQTGQVGPITQMSGYPTNQELPFALQRMPSTCLNSGSTQLRVTKSCARSEECD
jgi:hypothetical protein